MRGCWTALASRYGLHTPTSCCKADAVGVLLQLFGAPSWWGTTRAHTTAGPKWARAVFICCKLYLCASLALQTRSPSTMWPWHDIGLLHSLRHPPFPSPPWADHRKPPLNPISMSLCPPSHCPRPQPNCRSLIPPSMKPLSPPLPCPVFCGSAAPPTCSLPPPLRFLLPCPCPHHNCRSPTPTY